MHRIALWISIHLVLCVSTSAWSQSCSGISYPKSTCSTKLTKLVYHFAQFEDFGQKRGVRDEFIGGCNTVNNRGDQDSYCVRDKCESLAYIRICGAENFSKKLLPAMADGGELEVIEFLLKKKPELIQSMNPKDAFWEKYFLGTSIFHRDSTDYKIKLLLYEKGFVPDGAKTFLMNIDKEINTDRFANSSASFRETFKDRIEEHKELVKVYENSKLKKDVEVAQADIAWTKSAMAGSSLVAVSSDEFKRISDNYLGFTVENKDTLAKQIDLNSIALEMKLGPQCFDKNSIEELIAKKKIDKQIENYISFHIKCLPIKEKTEVINLLGKLDKSKMLTKEIFEQLYSLLPLESDYSEEEIYVLTSAVGVFHQETSLKLSLLNFADINKFADNLNLSLCSSESASHRVLRELHAKIIADRTDRFFEKLADPQTSFSELEKIFKEEKLNFAHPKNEGKGDFYRILSKQSPDRFTKEQWRTLTNLLKEQSANEAFLQIGGATDGSTPIGMAIKQQNVALFEIFLEIKKERPSYRFYDEAKHSKKLNRESGKNDQINWILKNDSYYRND